LRCISQPHATRAISTRGVLPNGEIEDAMDGIVKDLRLGFRMLARTPLLSIVAVLTIGLGVGATSFAFSVVYGTLMRGLPVPDADRLMVVQQTRPADGIEGMPMSWHDYREYRDQQTSFEHLAAGYSGTINIGGTEGPPERFQGGFVTARLLSVLGVPPLHGRLFTEGDDRPGAPPVLLLGYAAWRNRFGADPDVVGRTVRVNGEAATIIGVMPEGVRFPFNEDLWVALRDDADAVPRGQGVPVIVAGLLRRGVSPHAAEAELAAIARRLETTYAEHNEGVGVRMLPYTAAFMPSQISRMMLLLMAMVAGVLLVACANVANILMARAVVREKEVAIRSALGARRGRVIRQLLLEAAALGIAGGVVGLGVAWLALGLFNDALVDVQKPYWIVFRMDAPALLFTTAVTLSAAVLAGTVPALRATGGALERVLRDESRGSSSLRVGRFSTALVIGELAISCALMIGAGLLIRALIDMNRLDLGFDPAPVMTARLGLFEQDHPDADARNRFYERLLERLNAEPGVLSASLTTGLPAASEARWAVRVEGESYARESDVPSAGGAIVSPGFFETFGVRFVAGRDFRIDEAGRGGEPVVVVNRSFAEKRLGGSDILGRRIRIGRGDADTAWLQVIGVVADLHHGVGVFGGGNVVEEAIYMPLGTADPRFVSVALRTQGPPAGIAGALRAAVSDVDPNLPLYWVRPMQAALDETTFMHRIFGMLFAIFGSAALFLAAVGLYGVIDFSVSSRLREMGLRMALGAERADILRMVFRRVGGQLAIGIAIGVALGAGLAVPLAATLFGVERFDPLVYGAIVGTLAFTGMLAALMPALRAVRVDPVIALRA
jgi:putative ABC transport system permease protein